jgi:outer membrane protein OmpA-like peptidoglycan-associated protein
MHEPWNGHESRCDTSTGEHTVGPGPTTPSGPGNTPGADSNNPNNPTVLTFSADVWFEFDKAELLAEGKTALTTFADNIKTQNQQNTIVIEGHTDSVGTQTYNLALSQRRADAAKTFLVSLGIPAASIVAIGKGSSQPVAPNAVNGKDNPEGRSQNRRVNIVITGPYVVPSGSNEYLRFTVRTGDESHFEKCTTPMKNAVRAAGKAYYERTGRKITINSAFRSTEEEQAIYDAWVNAGGSASRPTVSTPGFGNLTTPVNPKAGGISPHSKGIAIDCQEAVDLDSLGILAKCGLKRPYSWDPLHINLS